MWKLQSSCRCRAFLHSRPFAQSRRFKADMADIPVNKAAHPFDKTRFEALLNLRFFYAPAFEIYGGAFTDAAFSPEICFIHLSIPSSLKGVAGLYDYGPPGSSLQANIIAEWRKHFIIEEHMLEIDSTIMTPAPVFETSGHVARFADWMVKDTKTGDVLRADHLVKSVLEARLTGDKEARGLAAQPPQKEDEKKKRKKGAVKNNAAAQQLPDDAVKVYEVILAQVRCAHPTSFLYISSPSRGFAPVLHSWTITQAQS